jgi:uncharacterized protein
MERRISLVTLGVRDLPRSVEFYRKVLGWKTSFNRGDPIAFFQLHGLVLGLYDRKALAKDAKVSPRGRGFRAVTLAHNVRTRRAVDAIFVHLRKHGAAIWKTPRATDWGGYSGYFADPDGHLWEVAHNPGWKLDRRGAVVLPK